MKTILTLLGFVLAAGGGIGTLTARNYMENHPEIEVQTTLANFFGATSELGAEAQFHLFMNDYGVTVALIGLALLALGLIWPKARKR